MTTARTQRSPAFETLPFQRLRHDLNLPRQWLERRVLPSWWEPSVATTAVGRAQGLVHLARCLGLDYRALANEEAGLTFQTTAGVKFKTTQGTDAEDVRLAHVLALQVARMAALGMAAPPRPISASAVALRQDILAQDRPWIDLQSLLDWCWNAGILVLHVSDFPKTTRKMEGMAASVSGRPVIILSKQVRQPAWLLFILAHELGHHALGHVQEGQLLVDGDVNQDNPDVEEVQANRFALELLCGDPALRFRAEGRWPNAQQLAVDAAKLGRDLQIDPGHVVLNYAHSMGGTFFGVANAALQHLDPTADAARLIIDTMTDRLDWSALPGDAAEFVMRMTKGDDRG